MKKIIMALCLVLILILMVTVFVACDKTDSEGNAVDTLVVYNWEDYIDESAETSRLDAFKEYYKETTGRSIDIVYSTFDTNETMLAKVLNNITKCCLLMKMKTKMKIML